MALKKILVLGVGAQGSAAAQRLDEDPGVAEIICADYDRTAVDNLVKILKKAKGVQVDAHSKDSIVEAARGVDLILNALPLECTKNVLDAALEVKANYQDYAATTSLHEDWVESVRIQYDVYGPKFREIGRTAIVGTGSAPGLICAATRDAMKYLDTCDTIYNIVWEGVEAKRFQPFWWSPVTALHDMSEKGYAYKTIDNYKRSLKASFYMAIQDDCIRKNPFEFKLSDVLEDDTEQKVILTPEQEERLLAFMEKDKIYSKYYDEVVLLLETGLRISEFCGLTTHIDMQNRVLNIDHQLLKDSEMGYYIETPKTKNGKRELPLTERAYQAIQRILKNRGKAQPLIVGGYSNFLFLNREGLPKVAGNYEGMVRGLIKKYNKYHTDKLPNITPHSFRHTYCTNMANRGMNPNTLQYLMGHANITMTLGYYAHGTFQSAKAELERLAC